jgi:hypothetical protein
MRIKTMNLNKYKLIKVNKFFLNDKLMNERFKVNNKSLIQ